MQNHSFHLESLNAIIQKTTKRKANYLSFEKKSLLDLIYRIGFELNKFKGISIIY